MKITIIHGQKHKGSTWNISKLLAQKLESDENNIKDIYVNDIPNCVGCFNCIMKGEEHCPHREFIEPIIKSIDESDVVIIESPNYCFGVTGQLKSLLDHFAYRWMPHRPSEKMFSKIGVCISTTAGSGAGYVTKFLKKTMFFLGFGKTYRISKAVGAMSWKDIKDKNKIKIEKTVSKTANKISKKAGKIRPSLKSKFILKMMGFAQKGNTYNETDRKYWQEKGWI